MRDSPGSTEAVHDGQRRIRRSLAAKRLVTSLKVNNLANQEVQQHIFGDIVKRQIVGEARFTF